MKRQRRRANSKSRRASSNQRGFSIIEIMVTLIVVAVLTGFGLLGISKARATIRLNGAAREYASYVEKIRTNSIRRHADDESGSARKWRCRTGAEIAEPPLGPAPSRQAGSWRRRGRRVPDRCRRAP